MVNLFLYLLLVGNMGPFKEQVIGFEWTSSLQVRRRSLVIEFEGLLPSFPGVIMQFLFQYRYVACRIRILKKRAKLLFG